MKAERHYSSQNLLEPDILEMQKEIKMMLERIISFLALTKNEILPGMKEILRSYENKLMNYINEYRLRKSMPPLQSEHMPPMPQSQSQRSLVLSHGTSQSQTSNLVDHYLRSTRGDGRDKVYQRETFSPDIYEILDEVTTKIQQHYSSQNRLEPDILEMHKESCNVLIISFFALNKNEILPGRKEILR
ncbi:unnamed protein product [Sphenostylis stenocarpa]|uniref:Uncharacterized protein n=1 Tax=Sphenostylis stenocarpa TaxID=92480 RepID=A0AA86TNW5_9FABA|nr:unnamed protein product [Sphenostylis stenocarpa]